VALAVAAVSLPLFLILLLLTTAPGPAYPSAWLSWFCLLVPLGAVGLALYALVPRRGRPAEGRGAAIAALAFGGLSFLLVSAAVRTLGNSRVGEIEVRPMGELRSLMSAQETYRFANGGYYGEPHCLSEPSRCLPEYTEGRPRFLSEGWTAETTRYGYRFVFRPGRSAERTDSRRGVLHAGFESYVWLAVPDAPQSLLDGLVGVRSLRSFCADSDGRVCLTGAGQRPVVANGRCAHADPVYEDCFGTDADAAAARSQAGKLARRQTWPQGRQGVVRHETCIFPLAWPVL
jgi:hypothetical protein